MAFAQRMKTKKVRMSGVHVFTHLRPTLGSTMVSRTNSTTHSIPFIRPDGSGRSWRRYRRTVHVTTTKTITATSHSMSTCLVTEKSMPKILGRWMSG